MEIKRKRKILFVDDEPGILGAMHTAYSRRFDVSTSQSPSAALELLVSEGPFALVVSDLRMPKMNGIDFLRHVCELSPRSVRVMLTGYADLDSAIEAVNLGQIFRFHTKPCDAAILRKTVSDAIDVYDRTRTQEPLPLSGNNTKDDSNAPISKNILQSKLYAHSGEVIVTADEIHFLLGDDPHWAEAHPVRGNHDGKGTDRR